ncbi:ribonucleoside-diphosphate reductase small chain-like [Culicoides brevitarsis]|uniref:ribonucleoside-diphosphate reductase small chain-like n=1 Tax=Culicoides brevitarsis TaxID=469753 RepID=UPI00307C8714
MSEEKNFEYQDLILVPKKEFLKSEEVIIETNEDSPCIWKEVDETFFPCKELMNFYHEQQKVMWNLEEVEPKQIQHELAHFSELPIEIKAIIQSILLFFTQADKLVIENVNDLINHVPYKAATYFYNLQNSVESGVHDRSYEFLARYYYNNDDLYKNDLILLDSIIHESNPERLAKNFGPDNLEFEFSKYQCKYYDFKNGIEKKIFQAVAKKINIMNKCKRRTSIVEKLVSFMVLETIGFNPIFAIINSIKNNNKGLSFLSTVNDFVTIDENIHARFGIELYMNYCESKLPVERVHEIIKEIAEIEIDFLKNIFDPKLIINSIDLDKYITYTKQITNTLSKTITNEILYHDLPELPVAFVTPQLQVKTNYFERTIMGIHYIL